MKPIQHYLRGRAVGDTYEIRAIPIFETCMRGKRRGPMHVFDKNWLVAAAREGNDRHFEASIDGDDPPDTPMKAHFGVHDGSTKEPERVGYLKDFYVQVFKDDSAELLATIYDIPAAVYDRIFNWKETFFAVEINDPDTPEIRSVALLESTQPFFRYPRALKTIR